MQNQSDIKLNQAIKEIGVKLNDTEFVQQTQQSINEAYKKIADEGWSFYGALNPDGEWRVRSFEIIDEDNTNNIKSKPSINNKIKAITDVNLRTNIPTYSNSEGWNYTPIKTVINYGQVVTVKDIKSIPTPKGDNYWVHITR